MENKETRTILLQIALFVFTFATTTLAGTEWAYGRSIIYHDDYSWNDFVKGMSFSIPLLTILTVHEFGHYFAAVFHRVKTSLPYYIPLPPIPYMLPSLGTFGAVIRLRSKPYKNLHVFDIGLAGPLAGFVVAIGFLIYGFSTLPPVEYIYDFHPKYKEFGADYAQHVYTDEYRAKDSLSIDLQIGKNLLFVIAEQFVDDPARIPNSHELMHYPLLFGVYFALFFTSLNLLPIGQFDGGHVVYGLFGYRIHKMIATAIMFAILLYAGVNSPWVHLSLPPFTLLWNTALYVIFLYFLMTGFGFPRQKTFMLTLLIVGAQFVIMFLYPNLQGYWPWFLPALILTRFVGIYHPPSEIEAPLNTGRVILGWITLLVFILCFSPVPLKAEIVQ